MTRTGVLIICTRPQDHAPSRVSEAAAHLSGRSDATEEERRLASEAIERLQSKRDDPSRHDRAKAQHEPPAGVIAGTGQADAEKNRCTTPDTAMRSARNGQAVSVFQSTARSKAAAA